MRRDELYLWFLANPVEPLYVGRLRLVDRAGAPAAASGSWTRELTSESWTVGG
jgi:hypothetical protein